MYPLVTIGACLVIIAGILGTLSWLWDGEKGNHG